MIAILVHGGAGNVPADQRERALEGCRRAGAAGFALLQRGASALDAVEQAVRLMEDDPAFNAGLGACLNAAGEVELDACIVDGERLRAGAVGALRDFPAPVSIARRLLERGEHVLLVAEGAAAFARAEGFEPCAPGALVTPEALARWQQVAPGGRAVGIGEAAVVDEADAADAAGGGAAGGGDTVGAVALDARGHVAAALSTGGILNKHPGRLGDSPLVGCGAYADDLGGAVAATGHGESIIRVVLAKRAVDALVRGEAPAEVARAAIAELEARVDGRAGVIVLGRDGRFGVAFNTTSMPHALCTGEHPAPRASCAVPIG